MSWFENIIRRARLRTLAEGLVQKARAEALDDDAKDDAERFQDYGFAANPVEGEGLVINAGGHTIVLRMDRLAERPQLGDYEVSVWHKEGHRVTLKAGKLVQVDCDELVINAANRVEINTPVVECSDKITAPIIEAATSLKAAGDEVVNHVHGGVARSNLNTNPL
jgi:phage gp45-like